ncbi:hypothetical protein [Allorhodopirellula solitaria]|uniref:Uncharacterized protein n=1 Tax=Allorhodopirellula solitaria TaxID=2527987 RepID=A0A5C5X0J8_9BACT|nr:hypothetical protein [Allorhodopirellula solitaria]TWT56476.1 hypothetical protein CA85_40060 [Allorhodopirellula solitaria]
MQILSHCLFAGAVILPLPLACLWDYDTLAVERTEFPGIHEMIVGQFARHSPAYYRWRIADRSAMPFEQRTPEVEDDIAVAHEKLGDHDTAIRITNEKIERWPVTGRYQSEANLATFLIHAGYSGRCFSPSPSRFFSFSFSVVGRRLAE